MSNISKNKDKELVDALSRFIAANTNPTISSPTPKEMTLDDPNNIKNKVESDLDKIKEKEIISDSLEQKIPVISSEPSRIPILRDFSEAYGKGLSSEDMLQALKEAREKEDRYNMMEGLINVGSGIAGMAGDTVIPKSSSGVFDKLRKRAMAPVEDIEKVRKAKEAEIHTTKEQIGLTGLLEDESAMMDKDSVVSQVYRDTASKLGLDIPKTATAKSLEKVLPMLKSIVAMTLQKFQQGKILENGNLSVFDPSKGRYIDTGIKAAKDLFQVRDPLTGETYLKNRRTGDTTETVGSPKKMTDKPVEPEQPNMTWENLNKEQRKSVDELSKEYRKESQDIIDFESTIKGLDRFVKENIDGTVGSIKRQLARTVGQEKGVMTDKDVAAFGGTDKIVSAIAQYAHAKVKGGMTDTIRDNFSKIIKVANKNIADKRRTIEERYYAPLRQKLPQANETAIKQFILGKVLPTSNKIKDKTASTLAKEDRVLVEKDGVRGTIPKANLEKALEKGYKLVR